MPASISVARLGWSTPDGRIVLDDLTLDFASERIGLVGRNGVGKSTLLKLLAGDLTPMRGTVRTRGTITMLRQTVQVTPNETIADLFGVAGGLNLLRQAEAGTATLDELAQADWTLEARAAAALAEVCLDLPLVASLAELSGGQRTRAALAGAILAGPDMLLLDEPTNNLDADGRAAVIGLLRGWQAGAIVVSHDRALLEEMDAIVELSPLGARRYGGNWSAYQAQCAIERAAAAQDLSVAQRRVSDVARAAQLTAERKQRRDAAGARKGAKGDMPRILAGQRRDRAEKSGGGNVRLAERLRADAARDLGEAQARVERIEPLAIALAPTGLPSSKTVLTLDRVTVGYDPAHPILHDVSLTITGPERIALTGPNGAGKSTLLAIMTGQRAPLSGRVARHVPHAVFNQRLGLLDPVQTIAENYARLNPGTAENGCRAALARFRFRAEAADQRVGTLSGGQMLRAGLACVLGGPVPPPLLLLDEPTNHLDLDSVEAIERALCGYDGALLVVSHDAAFLDAIGIERRIALSG